MFNFAVRRGGRDWNGFFATTPPTRLPHSDRRSAQELLRVCVQKPKEISRYSGLCLSSATSYGASELEYLQSIFNLADIVLGGGSELVPVVVVGGRGRRRAALKRESYLSADAGGH